VKAGDTGEKLGLAAYIGLATPIIGEVGLYPPGEPLNPGEDGDVLKGELGDQPPPGLRAP